MKKFLFGILTFLGIGLSFCSADGIYRDSTGGLISVVLSGQTVWTLQDKNLGASCTDTSNFCSYGNHYQRGNNYGFNPDLTYSSSNNSITLEGYGPGNYFNSNGVFYSYVDPINSNAWGFASGTYEDSQGPCAVGYNVPLWTQFVSDVSNFGITSDSQFKQYFLLPFAGLRVSNDSVVDQYDRGLYWSNRLVDGSVNAFFLHENGNNISVGDADAFLGMSIRCFKNVVVEPDYTWIKLYGDTIDKPVSIDVYYDYDNSFKTIACNGENSIHINGLATYSNNGVFTPYYNILYSDQDGQVLSESYSKQLLYLDGKFKKTYTGGNDNYWILTPEGVSESVFTGYLPVFDFTGDTIVNSGNVFNNFSDNALKVLLSNIPSYIQYITIFMILVFLFSFIRRFKRKS